jgi:DNA-binding winged helix-turn-helix (wHTH) protein/tetratricopeptide (TPR) repeat protein
MSRDSFQFEDFVLNRSVHELRRGSVSIPLQRIPLELLFLLVERRGHIVTREEILDRVWGKGVFVDSETSINTAIRKIRRALSDNPEAPRFVLTVPAKGYRFVAAVRETNQQITHGVGEAVRATQRSMVGRERELALLLGGLDDAASGHGRLFLISGEPGVGKTRLAAEVTALAQANGMTLMIGHCSERDEAVAYLPFVEILESCVDRASNPDALRRMLGTQGSELAHLLPKLRTILPELPLPLDLPPAQARRHLFSCVLDFAARIASERPTLMILEDLHWADDSTLSLLDHLTQRLSDLQLMVIGTYRDAELDLTRGLANILEASLRGRLATRVTLSVLPRDGVAAMLKSLSGKSPPASIVSAIHAETEGNPFFVEELFRHLEEENRLYDSAGRFRSELKIGETEAPPSVRLIVMGRLKRLSEATRMLLATAAVIGRSFDFALLQASHAARADSLLECIEEGERAGLIRSVAESRKARFEFSHELTRQAVLSGLSALRRERLHLNVADAIERVYSPASGPKNNVSHDDHVAELAYHYAHGGNPDKAVEYCLRSAQKFAHLGSRTEALAQFHSGLELLQDLPDGDRRAEIELDLRNAVFGVIGNTKGYSSPEAEQSYARAMEICQRPGIDWQKTWVALFGMFFVQQLRPNVGKGKAITNDLIAVAQRRGSIGYLAEAENWSAYTSMVSGAFEVAASTFDRAWTRLESFAHPSLTEERALQMPQGRTIWQWGTLQNNRILAGWNLWFLGYPDRALDRLNWASALAQLPGAPKDILADIHGFATYIYELRRELAQMKARAAARLALANEEGFFTGRAIAEIYLGWADALGGDVEVGIPRMKRYLLELRAAGSGYISDRCLAFLAAAFGQMGSFDEGLRAIDEGFQFIERTGQRYYEAELHRLKGELLLAQNSANVQAEECFRTAIDVARRQHAKSWELRATTSLVRLLRDTNLRDEARAMLAETYNWFTEGFNTQDLKDARGLLNELSNRNV